MRFDDAFPPIWGRLLLLVVALHAWHVCQRTRSPDAVHGVCRACGVQRSAMHSGEGSVREDPSAAAHAGVRHGQSFTSRAAFFMGAQSEAKLKKAPNSHTDLTGGPSHSLCEAS